MASVADKEYAVQMRGIKKYFGSFCALNGVQHDGEKGTIHALLGENGAGKSTLMNILYGLYQADEGEILINGRPENIKNPATAIKLGIGMVHQHFMLVEPFTVTQNIMLGMEKTRFGGVIDEASIRKDVLELSERYGLIVDPDARIEDISVGMQQRVEILKALYRGAEILILDEPTAVLTPQEIGELIEIMRKLASDGKTVIIITHKLGEIKKSADYCTIIRRGVYIDTVRVEEVDETSLASMMVGREVKLTVTKEKADPGEVILEIDGLTVADSRGIDRVKDLSLQVRRGEIVGIAGIDGNGQQELVEAIMNMVPAKSGTITVKGREIQNRTPAQTLAAGVSTITEVRHTYAPVLAFSVAENFVIENFRQAPYSSHGILDHKAIKEHAAQLIEKFDVRPAGCELNPARGLSGGNQQKLIIAREVDNDPDILIAVQPTRGLDVGAIEYVHKALINVRDQGKAVLLISLELDEVMDVSDRIAVIYDGTIVDSFDAEGADENHIGLMMAGGKRK